MNHRRSIAAVGFAGVLALAACGTDDQITQPAARPASASQDAAEAFQHYYDVTRPQQPGPAFNGDAKDHPGYGQSTPAFNGDAKDHPSYGQSTSAFNGDAKDHPRYGRTQAGESGPLALQAPVSPKTQDFRTAFQAELRDLAEGEGLTGLSPAFLQPVGRILVGNPR